MFQKADLQSCFRVPHGRPEVGQAGPWAKLGRGLGSHLGTRQTGFTGATSFTRRAFGASRARRTAFTSRTLGGRGKSQGQLGYQVWASSPGPASSSSQEGGGGGLEGHGRRWEGQGEAGYGERSAATAWSTGDWAVGWEGADSIWKRKVMGRGPEGQPPATKRGYLGTSNTICSRETAATRSTLREERRSVSSDVGPGWHWGRRRGNSHARQGVRAGRQVRVHLGLLASLPPQQGQGVLEYQWGPGEGREEGAACSASSRAGLRLGRQHQALPFLPASPLGAPRHTG